MAGVNELFTIIPAMALHAVIEIIPLPASFTTISPTTEGREETAPDGRHLAAVRIASNDMIQTIAGRAAPELTVPYWIDADGKEGPPLTLEELGARHRLLFFFQHCGGCHSAGFPTLQALVKNPRNKNVGFAAVQTAFEGTYVNTRDKLPLDQQRYGLRISFGHESRSPLGVNPTTMENYCTGGTPWFVAIDPNGVVLADGVSIDAERFIEALGETGPAAP